MSGLNRLGVNLGMRTHRLNAQIISQHPSAASASEDSESGSDDESDLDVFEDNSSAGDKQAKSDVLKEANDNKIGLEIDGRALSSSRINRRRSYGDTLWNPSSSTLTKEREPGNSKSTLRKRVVEPLSKSKNVSLKDHVSQSLNPPSALAAGPSAVAQRPAISRHISMPKFSSKPVPVTKIATEDGLARSIMFSETPSPPHRNSRFPLDHHKLNESTDLSNHVLETSERKHNQDFQKKISYQGSNYSTQHVPLSFNDMPCRAQHLILNELIRKHSADTAVIFTTLPSPIEGTSKDEEASMAYLSNLEVLSKGCPPCLMVHSNSMTVTMSL